MRRLVSAAGLDSELVRTWYQDRVAGFDPADTAQIIDFAYPGTYPTYSFDAIEALIRHGYRSARATGFSTNLPIGASQYASWDHFTNMYTIRLIIV